MIAVQSGRYRLDNGIAGEVNTKTNEASHFIPG